MAYSIEHRNDLRAAYVHQALSLEAAADKVGIAFGTASRWKRDALASGDDWDKARAASHMAGGGAEAVTQAMLSTFITLYNSIVTDLSTQADIPALSKAEALSRLSDAYHKTMVGAARGAPKLARLSIALEVVGDFANFVAEHHQEAGGILLKALEQFEPELRVKYG